MSLLTRLFGRDGKPAASPDNSRIEATLAAPAPGPTGTRSPDEPAAAEANSYSESAAQTAAQPAAASPEVPLRSLQRYRHDPAFKNFMAKAQRRPGAAARRPGVPADVFDRDERPR